MSNNDDNPWGEDPKPSQQPKKNAWPPSGYGRKPEQDELEEFLRRQKKFFDDHFNNGNFLKYIAIAIAALWIFSGLYRVRPNEAAVTMVFGQWTNKGEVAREGLHYNWPAPIGRVDVVNVTADRKVSVGYTDTGAGRTNANDLPEESQMLTGDQNIVDIDFRVLWNIQDAGAYLFNVAEPEMAVKRVAESAMREVIGQQPIVFVLSDKRKEIEVAVAKKMQQMLNEYKTGIRVREVLLEAVNPPEQVVDAFREVQRARTDAETAKNQAEAYRNDILPRAEGQALKVRQEAEAYKAEVVSRSTGDAARFNAVATAFRANPEITRQRLYLETMEEIFSRVQKVVVEKGGATPILPLSSFGASGSITVPAGEKKQ